MYPPPISGVATERADNASFATARGATRHTTGASGLTSGDLRKHAEIMLDVEHGARFLMPKRTLEVSIARGPARQSRLGGSLLLDGPLDVLHGAFHLAFGAVYLALLLELLVAGQGACGLLDLAFGLVDYFAHYVLAWLRRSDGRSRRIRLSVGRSDGQMRS
jgi:hypothetical protein